MKVGVCGILGRQWREHIYFSIPRGLETPQLFFIARPRAIFRSKILLSMGIMSRMRGNSPTPASSTADPEKKPKMLVVGLRERFSPRILLMAVIVSMGGFIFGYDTGQISGFLEMPDFLTRFADTTDPITGKLKFSNGRSGTIVALVRTFRHESDYASN